MEAISFWLECLPGIIGRITIVARVHGIHTIRGISWRAGHSWRIALITRIGRDPLVGWTSLRRIARHWIWRIALRWWITRSLLLRRWMAPGRGCRWIDLPLRWRIRHISGPEEWCIRGIGRERTGDMFAVGGLRIDSLLLRRLSLLFSGR